jgi:hypothetical protein
MTFFIKTNGYPVQEDFRLMAQNLQRTNTQIKTWFNAQRFKLKTKKFRTFRTISKNFEQFRNKKLCQKTRCK